MSAQTVLQSQTERTDISISSDADLSNFLSQKFKLTGKNIKLIEKNKIESLTGTHYTYALIQEEVEFEEVYIKAHVSKEYKLFYLQYNVDQNSSFTVQPNLINNATILEKIGSAARIESVKKVYSLNKMNEFQEALKIRFYNEAHDIYLERIYFSETEFLEENLKVHFAPIDTTIKGKVFLPDPLTSSDNEYGGNYQDAFSKDTSILIIKTIPNVGQSQISSDSSFFVIHGDTIFDIKEQIIGNNFTGSTIYFVFEDIYFDVDGNILGYNTTFYDNVTDSISQLIIEDYDYPELNAERMNIEVLGDYSSSVFNLKNKVFELVDFSLPFVAPYTSPTNNFDFNRSHSAFEDINTFYHFNNFHSYIESLGFINLDPEKLRIDAHGNNGGDNSFFTNLPNPRITFGEGGVDDAEDADVIIHEYAHALSYFGSPGTNTGAERKALDEALGDYFASSYSLQYNDFNSGSVFSWDGHNEFWGGRINNSDSTYLDYNESKSIYYNAQIWSATLMDIYNVIGNEGTDKLVLESLFYNIPNGKFTDAADNLLIIDSVLNNKDYKCDIYNALTKRNFKSGVCVGDRIVSDFGIYSENTKAFAENSGVASFYVVEENFQSMDVWVSNALGQIVYQLENTQSPSFELNVIDFNEGLYYLRIQTNNKKGKYKYKLIKH